MLYFRHDIGAFKDEKVQTLRIECGGAAVDAFYAFLEIMYERETPLTLGGNRAETKSVCHWLCTDWETLETYIQRMGANGLLEIEHDDADGSYTMKSDRAEKAIASFHARSETARQNGKKGGRPKGSKTKAKAKKTKSVNLANQEQTESKPYKKQKEKEYLVGTTNQPNIQRGGVAATAGAATPSAPICPNCGSGTIGTNSSRCGKRLYVCPDCFEEVYA